jgi:hypothetical protein
VAARLLPTALVLILLAATAAAFALTERAKLELSPIYGTQPNQVFSPDGKVRRLNVARLDFRIRHAERVDVWIEDGKGRKVAGLLVGRSVHARQRLQLIWDGFTTAGTLVPDGVYHPVVKLANSHRTIVLPSSIRLDTAPPKIVVHPRTKYPIISPDGDGHADVFRIPYQVSEPARAILLLRGRRVVLTKSQKLSGELSFNGKVKVHGVARALRPGRYTLEAAAQDVAGNRSKGVPFAIVQVRYVTLARTRVVVRPGGRFALRVSTDAPHVEWRLHGRSGTLPRGTLHLRAPKKPGVYRLYVTVGNHSAVCSVVVA